MSDAQVERTAFTDQDGCAARNIETARAPDFKALLDVLATLEAEFGTRFKERAARAE
jgi:hypothetical protein